MIIPREDDHLAVYLKCLGIEQSDNWSIDARFEISTLKVNDNSVAVVCNAVTFIKEKDEWGAKDFIEWEKLKSLVVGDELTIVIEMKIKKMIGVYKPNLRNFDESMKTYSDVVLEVQNVKFYVAKLTSL
ncbi:hypothetical protein CAEBREN_10302 [Caenorhabditis brenneri]|uniref:MATH domain-containing protein n=1 Tax=Caenorhabditis brenneri TaxID=135651 RepID=G0MD59_CAEBE|nr:hypothetical protein CAEBREN_10302 [Caenorhabditis brenneri]